MSRETRYGVQTFVRDRKGRKAQGRLVSCSSADEAKAYADRCVARAAAVGAVAFARSGGGEFDEGDEPVTLAAFGDLPPEALAPS